MGKVYSDRVATYSYSLGAAIARFYCDNREDKVMKRFMLLHLGFEKPTPEIMGAWGKWFEATAGITTDKGGFHGGAREITKGGSKDLPMGMDSITGYSIIEAESLEDAEKIASANPFIAGIRVYEIM